MTPKEKAKDLVYKFYPSVQWKLGQEDCLDRAKRCSLIVANEIIEELLSGIDFWMERRIKYWQEVKQEIEQL